MDHPICITCHRPILFTGETVTMDGRVACACICKAWNLNITTSNSTTVSPMQTEGFNKFLRNMRDWNVTLHGSLAREPVPDAFQAAFKDGELEL